ncbi:MAG TPA: class F sortase [Negativicutes bacterium]|nr:class F sortase [Negativicutes bacterium]
MSKKPFFISIIFTILLASGVLLFATYGNGPAPLGTPENKPETGGNAQHGPGLPARLIIGSIGVDASIIHVALDAKGNVDAPTTPHEVAWFQLGPRPGTQGSAVITGHYGPWQSGANSVFDNLRNLKTGSRIDVEDDRGAVRSFVVTGSRTYSPDESAEEVFNKDDGVYLNLITCSGDWLGDQKTYTERLVIFAKAI